MAYSSKGSVFATAGSDKTVKIWDAKNGSASGSLSGASAQITCVDYSPNDEFILAACNDNVTRIWSTKLGRIKHTLNGHLGRVNSGTFTSDSTKVVTGSLDKTIKLWDLSRGYCTKTIFGFSGCTDVAITHDSSLIVSGHLDNTLRFWDPKTGSTAYEMKTPLHNAQITSIKLSPDGYYLLTSSRDHTLKIIELRTFNALQTLKNENYRNAGNCHIATWSPNAAYVLSGSSNGSLFIWDTLTAQVSEILKGHKYSITACLWSSSGSNIVSSDKNGSVVLWE
eukprot:TRINITY_DN5525_c0_g1_i1.p1 TRINITY_DN5525_c0_g1~~TRINITY_DN5525_c0_g1_i1.p1  ORF type:complete len:281 (+),score=46.69 TRINITY_DN5525_c0_g1_i1:841-1683(+)